ncbi:sensor histidine kinase [Actinomadura kijaniata]|uniref:histidine kinase n=1 Tax=Actinomadura namibiensis TaxID=182080 RepID=A0A7W3LTW8_ACTNM|nr:histidine kinase [Actinomadura namibiensis]MBA8954135.1 signal transduction histidine kinase [Actinomadura namibiensis]
MLGGLWEWWRHRRFLVDAFFAAPLVLLAALSQGGDGDVSTLPGSDFLVYWVLHAGLLLPLVGRRRWPRAMFAVIALVCFLQWLARIPLVTGDVAVLYGLYAVTAYCSFRWGLGALLVTLLGGVMEATQLAVSSRDFRWSLTLLSVVGVGVWLLGLHMRTRRAYLRSLEERAERLERERGNELQVARAAERARIARELHDVVAHNVSVIVVQADGAAFALETDPDRARKALETIAETGRTALAEMRRLVGVLRENAHETGDGYAPQPGVEQLTELVDQMHGSGLPVTLTVDGTPIELSEGRQLTIFRVVQEALTNTLKHGGPRAAARVTVRYAPDAIEVRVSDDGRGAAAFDDGRGHGLMGMRERVAVYGGRVRAAPLPGGGFEVIARIPVREEART